MEMLGLGDKQWGGQKQTVSLLPPPYFSFILSLLLISVQLKLRQTGAKVCHGTMSRPDKEKEHRKQMNILLPSEPSAWEGPWSQVTVPTTLCGAAGKKSNRKWKSVFSPAFRDSMAHPNPGWCTVGTGAMEVYRH